MARHIYTRPAATKKPRLSLDSGSTAQQFNQKTTSAMIEEVVDKPAMIFTELHLTDVESTLRCILLDVVDYIEQNPSSDGGFQSQVKISKDLLHEKPVLRITGGWVRDKLLGQVSHDIDIAINNMTGEQFGLKLEEYMNIPGNAQKYNLEGFAETSQQDAEAGTSAKSKIVGSLHKIEANPERSKHLETVTTRILGLDIDLVNLRKETYSDESRNPQIEFGTPEEDALRRDATANAMFFNLHTREVEDFTGKGLADLQAKFLRTPLEPYQTFKDDPLRILRLIRFASRLGWTIDPEALEAMQNKEIKDALRRKISRERVGIELEKALRGPDPHEALRLIYELGLYDTIFCDPTHGAVQDQPDTSTWKAVVDNLQDIIQSEAYISRVAIRDAEEEFLAWQLSTTVPYRNAAIPEAMPGRKAPPPHATMVAREGIKATGKFCELVTASVRHAHDISNLVEQFSQQKSGRRKPNEEDALARDVLGMKIRTWGSTWRSQVVYSLLVDIAENVGSANALRSRYAHFLQYLEEINLLDVCELRPLLDGKMIAKALDTKPGPWMKDALDVVMAWQLRNPNTTDTTAAIDEVKKHGELATSLTTHFLKLTVRPLFLKTRSSAITDQARRQTAELLPPRASADDETVTKPWKQPHEQYALKLLDWSVHALNKDNVEMLWPLIIPPILTLIDDWEIQYKKMGALLLHTLLEATPEILLKRTGLGPVFEQALLPCLTYLPPLTEEADCLSLLPVVYDTLILLAHKQYPDLAAAANQPAWMSMPPERVKALDTLMRKGVLYEYAHVGERPAVVGMLFHQLQTLVQALGIDAVKHLKYILPMLNETLTHPLGTSHIGSLRTAVQSMAVIVEVCRLRIGWHRGDVLKGLTMCWLNIIDDNTAEGRHLRADLRKCAAVLRAAVEADGGDWEADCAILVSVDARLADLLS